MRPLGDSLSSDFLTPTEQRVQTPFAGLLHDRVAVGLRIGRRRQRSVRSIEVTIGSAAVHGVRTLPVQHVALEQAEEALRGVVANHGGPYPT